MAMIASFALWALQMALVLLLAPLVTGLVRKAKARLTRRRGASILQPWRDLARLLRKEVVLADNASWFYAAAPYAVFALTWLVAGLIPTFVIGQGVPVRADLVTIVGLLAAARFALALAGMDVGTGFGGIGASREMMISALAEPAMILVVFTLALAAGSTDPGAIAGFMGSSDAGLRVSLGMALVALVMVAIAENARIPIDNPATHLELTMVHEAMLLEYSGRHLALIELAASMRLMLSMALIACLFLPWGLATPGAGPAALALGLVAFLGKLTGLGLLLAGFETAIAKMRVFRVPQFLGAALMLGLLGALLLFVSRSI